MTSSLVGSEMCIRDRTCRDGSPGLHFQDSVFKKPGLICSNLATQGSNRSACLLYTSDAADDM
eukprot:723141-Prorocentrum_lima.AAC.1